MRDGIEIVLTVLGALGTWTVTVVLTVTWLNKQFNSLRDLVYRKFRQHEELDRNQFEHVGNRLMRIEYKMFGATETPPPYSDEGRSFDPR